MNKIKIQDKIQLFYPTKNKLKKTEILKYFYF